MRSYRVWSACAVLLLAASVTSCAEGQFGQVVQTVGKNMAKGMCAEGGGPVSAAPEFCFYVEDMQVMSSDTRLDVVMKAVNRTGRPLYLGLSRAGGSTSDGIGLGFAGASGIASSNGASPLALEPGGEGTFVIHFVINRWGGPDTTISLNGEIGIIKVDSRGQPAAWFGSVGPGVSAVRAFNLSRVGMRSQQPVQPLQQKSSNTAVPGVA